jgi:hypothetical protein
MTQLLLEKVETILYDACDNAPFFVQIDKYNKVIGLLSFVDKNTNNIIPIPDNIEVCAIKNKRKLTNESTNELTNESTNESVYGLPENKIEKVANKPCFTIITHKHYVVLWENKKILELKPIVGWTLI